MQSSRFQPALYGGLVLGVLSALPIISVGNACCCLWVVTGGVVAAYVLQSNQSTPIALGDGAAVGLLAGLIGSVIWQALAIPIALATGPLQERMVERLLTGVGDMPENVRPILEAMRQQGGTFAIVGFVFGLMMKLLVGSLFATIGGLIGAAFFAKKMPAPGAGDLP